MDFDTSTELLFQQIVKRFDTLEQGIEKLANRFEEQSCKDCSTTISFKEHIEEHKDGKLNKTSWFQYLVVVGISIVSLIKSFQIR